MIDPVEKSIFVPLPPARAFALFTEHMADWWPLDTHSISANRDGTNPHTVTFEPHLGGRVLETCSDGEIRAWATITDWQPGVRFVLSWYVGRTEDQATVVDVRFEPEADGTRLLLTHSGFDVLGDQGLQNRTGYNGGWTGVLESAFLKHCAHLGDAA